MASFALNFLAFPTFGSELFLDDPQSLAQLEVLGFDFARLVLNEPGPVKENESLVKNSQKYSEIVQSLSADLESLKQKDSKLFVSMKGTHRLFDSHWLIANYSAYELVGIVNRMDRLSFNPSTCGELRFIYRLAYKTLGASYSRLPMTINSVFWIPRFSQDCARQVRQWKNFLQASQSKDNKNLSPIDLPLGKLKSLEINLQAVRWPSTVRPDMAGYAEYFLRVFQNKDGRMVAGTLENTPDVERLEADAKLRSRLQSWITDPVHLKAIDQGVALLPEEFLTNKATSVALHGVHRFKNAPFSSLFSKQDFEKVDFKSFDSIKSSQGLLRRLNDLSCVGCHQGRTVAGFHFLGKDKLETDSVNSIFISASPHFLLDQKRRIQFNEPLERKQEPDQRRPLSVRAVEGEGRMGSHCGLGDPSFKSWTCENGFHCLSLVEDTQVSPTGICISDQLQSGSPCETGPMTHSRNPWSDRLKLKESTCGNQNVCESSSVGFPNGMCSNSCRQLKPGETCGSIANLFGFNQCLSKGKLGFAKCLSENVRPGSLQECDDKNRGSSFVRSTSVAVQNSCSGVARS